MSPWFRVLLAALALALAPTLAPAELNRLPGSAYQSEELRKLQSDDFANPGLWWVDDGARLWREPTGAAAKSCADCHGADGASLKGAAARHPRFDESAGRIVNLEGRINLCREKNQGAPALAYESPALLALTVFVARLSAGMPMSVSAEGRARTHQDNGRRLFHMKIGQMNLSCADCHDRNVGKVLLAERISEGNPTGFPAYRLEWQTLGSLHRRFRACASGVRAEMLPLGAPDYLDLELYLAVRAQGVPIEAPGVRR